MVALDQNTLATLEGAKELLKNFVVTYTLILLEKKLVEVTTQLIKAALGLLDEGITKLDKSYVVVEEISTKKGPMCAVKDVHDL